MHPEEVLKLFVGAFGMKSTFKSIMICLLFIQGCGGGGGGGGSDSNGGNTTSGDDATTPPDDYVTETQTGVWTWRNALPQGNGLHDIAWNGSLLVAVGINGTIITSPDHEQWTVQNSGTELIFESVIWTGSQFVAVGGTYSQTGLVATSPDGIAWTVQNTGITTPFYDVAWDGNQMIAVGEQGTIARSMDGINWSQVQVSANGLELFYGIEWTGERFVAVGMDGTGGITLISPNGTQWSEASVPSVSGSFAGIGAWPTDVVWTGNLAVAVGTNGLILSSSDGRIWEVQDSGTTDNFARVIWTGSRFIAMGISPLIYTSEDGATWTPHDSTSDVVPLFGAAWTGSRVITVGAAGVMLSSNDGLTWQRDSYSVTDMRLNDVAWNGDRYVAVGYGGVILTSDDGTVWTKQEFEANSELRRIIWTGNQFLAVGNSGTIVSSSDGVNWSAHQIGQDVFMKLNDIAWSGTQFVAVGDHDSILTSHDGVSWTVVSYDETAILNSIQSVVWSGDEFVAVGGRGFSGARLITSADGVTWTEESTITTSGLSFQSEFKNISFNGDQFLILSELDNYIYISDDGDHWASYEYDIDRGLWRSHWTGTNYIAVGNGVVASSGDGISWTEQMAMTEYPLLGVASSDGQVVVVGDVGNIFSINY
ncbi:MAG: hypothetical protein P8163_04240 [Candidatus Thiodiazotropha sp.]